MPSKIAIVYAVHWHVRKHFVYSAADSKWAQFKSAAESMQPMQSLSKSELLGELI